MHPIVVQILRRSQQRAQKYSKVQQSTTLSHTKALFFAVLCCTFGRAGSQHKRLWSDGRIYLTAGGNYIAELQVLENGALIVPQRTVLGGNFRKIGYAL